MIKCIAAMLALSLMFSLTACAPQAEGPDTADDPAAQKPMNESTVELMNLVHYPAAISYEDYDANRENREQNAVEDSFIAGMDAFAFNTAVAVLGTAKENANYSPLSLYLALALATVGAEGETRAEMLSLLGAEDEAQLRAQCARLYRLLYTDNEISKLKIANSLWLDDAVQGMPVNFKAVFLKAAAEDFYASAYSADFADEAAGRAMAAWVSENTNGTLSPVFEVDPNQIMSILNTVYFYDEWIDAFQEANTKPSTFHAAGGDVRADFMNRKTAAGFARGENFLRAGLNLKNHGQMVFILPDEGVNVYDLLTNDDAVRELFRGGTEDYGEVTWSVPKFAYGCKYDLADTLAALGMATAFDAETADFSGITDSPAWLSSVTQQTHIAIDEKGVEAAAFTELGFAGMGLPQGHADMILDRPFLYGIFAQSGTLLFMGVCADPTAVS